MTAILTWLAGSRVGRVLAAVLAAMGAAFLVYQTGRRDARQDIEREALEDAFDNIDDARRARRDALAAPPDRLRDDDGYRID